MSKTIVITGTSSGVGLEAAKFFLEKGWVVIGLARTRQESLGEQFYSYVVDIQDGEDVEAIFNTIQKDFGTVDFLVNNAARFITKDFAECSVQEISSIIDTNLKGTMYCTLAALKIMKAGRIINIDSVSGVHGIKNQAIYSASKFGVAGFAEALGQETVGRGILISTIYPGGIETPLWNQDNQYGGDVSKLLQPIDVVSVINFICELPDRVVLKDVTMFPTNEWH